jgi:uncharacterized protein (TIGR03067 family)
MLRKWLLVLTAVPLLGTDEKQGDARKDHDALQGTWQVVALEQGGNKAPEEDLKRDSVRLVIKGDKLTFTAGGAAAGEGTFKLDPEKKAIDATVKRPDGKEEKSAGIYELKGDELRLFLAPGGEGRPTRFESKAGSRAALLTCKRVKDKE